MLSRFLALLLALAAPEAALAQAAYPTPTGQTAAAVVDMCPVQGAAGVTNQFLPCDTPGAITRRVTVTNPTGGAQSHSSVTALGTSLLAKPSAGQLFGFYCAAITGGAAGYCVAYNSSAVPGTGALTGANVLDICFFAAGPAGCSLSRIPNSATYSAGIVILVTSAATPFTYTTGVDTAFISADFQ